MILVEVYKFLVTWLAGLLIALVAIILVEKETYQKNEQKNQEKES